MGTPYLRTCATSGRLPVHVRELRACDLSRFPLLGAHFIVELLPSKLGFYWNMHHCHGRLEVLFFNLRIMKVKKNERERNC